MNIGARTACWSGGWKNPYVTDGLIAMWDGEWNVAGGTHDNGATTWKDIVGGRIATLTDQSFGDNYLHVSSGYASVDNGVSNSALTAEIVVRGNQSTNDWCFIYNENAWQIGANYGRFIGYMAAFFIASNSIVPNVEFKCRSTSSRINYLAYALPKIPVYLELDIVDRAYFNNEEIDKVNINSYNCSKDDSPKIGMCGSVGRGNFDIYAIRFYSKTLSADEILHNYAIDKARFGLT